MAWLERIIVWACLLALCLTLSGCGTRPKRSLGVTGGLTEVQPMETAVREHVPVGTPLADAIRMMEQEGFQCSVTRDGSFAEREQIDYIDCVRRDQLGRWVTQSWRVALVLEGNQVADVLVSHGLTGP